MLTAIRSGKILLPERIDFMRKLVTIQKRENLNAVYAVDEKGNGGANHFYEIRPADDNPEIMGEHHILASIEF